jgi:hypothetical protein
MKKKPSPKKKVAPKKKMKLTELPRVKLVPIAVPGVRVISASQQENAFHIVRVVNDCATSNLKFDTIEEVNAYLFKFDMENFGKSPYTSGTWIDSITTNVHGDFFDLDELESDRDV